MQREKFAPCGVRVCAIKVLSYENRNPTGILKNPNFETDIAFKSLTELLFAMEELFDDLKNPQRAMKPRGGAKETELRPAAPTEQKPLAVFTVDVMFRQNASWQGNLVWTEKKEESSFRSVLELIGLMDCALSPDQRRSA